MPQGKYPRLIKAPTPTPGADPAEVEKAAARWSEIFLQCRTYGHHWEPARATWNARERYFHQIQRCRCTSERHAEIGERGQKYAQWIDYAEGYLLEGLGRIGTEGRDVLRLASLRRSFPLEELSDTEAAQDRPHSAKTREAIGYTEHYLASKPTSKRKVG